MVGWEGLGRSWQKGNWDLGTGKVVEKKATTKDYHRGEESPEKANGKEVFRPRRLTGLVPAGRMRLRTVPGVKNLDGRLQIRRRRRGAGRMLGAKYWRGIVGLRWRGACCCCWPRLVVERECARGMKRTVERGGVDEEKRENF
jgi:hypothetical protein